MTYEAYAALVPAGKLDLVLDEEHGGLEIHLGRIADATDEWETVLAPHMGIKDIEMKDIRANHRDNRALQRREILRLWKAKLGGSATYGNLLKICVNNKSMKCATVITKLWSESDSQVAVHNIGTILKLKRETPEYRALKKYEDELIDSLQSTDLVALIKKGVEHDLIPASAKSLDPDIQHELVCKYVFFNVYSAIKEKKSGVKRYEQWLGLLGNLKNTTQVVFKLKQYHRSLVKALGNRLTSLGLLLKKTDLPLLTEVLADQCSKKWKQITTSLGFHDNEIVNIRGMVHLRTPAMYLEELLARWITGEFSESSQLTTGDLVNAVNTKMASIQAIIDQIIPVWHRENAIVAEADIPYLHDVLYESYGKWKEIATGLELSEEEIEYIISTVRISIREKYSTYPDEMLEEMVKSLRPPMCLKQALTTWVTSKSSKSKLKMLEKALCSEGVGLSATADKLAEDLMSWHKGNVLITKDDIPYLCETLEDVSSAWKEIAAEFLHLSAADIEYIMNRPKCTSAMRLKKALAMRLKKVRVMQSLGEMIVHGTNRFSLESVLRREIIDLEAMAAQLSVYYKKKITSDSRYTEGFILAESDIPDLTVSLSTFSEKWDLVASSFGLSDSERERIQSMTHMYTPVMCLKQVLTKCIAVSIKPPMLENLEEALDSHAVGLKAVAANDWLRDNLINCSTKTDSSVQAAEGFRIVSQSSKPGIAEGFFALFEVQVSSSSSDSVGFEWFGCEELTRDLPKSAHQIMDSYHGLSVGILGFHVENMTVEGAYTCKIHHQGQSLESEPIVLTVRTPIDQYKRILTDFYTEQPEVPEDTWPPAGSNTYINLALIKQESLPKAVEYGRGTIRGDVDDVYGDKESIVYDIAFNNLESGVRLLVEGRPGSGKTTLTNKVSRDWASGKLTFLHNRLLFLVHLRAFCSDPNVGLQELIKCFYDIDSTIADIRKYAQKHNGVGLCFILDGLDEYIPNKSEAYIFKLIKKQVLPKAIVIVASRPAAAANYRKIATRRVEVIGFLKAQISDFIKKYPFSGEDKCDELHSYLDQHPNVHHMCYLPIHSVMVCLLFDIDTNLPQTETEIYSEFTKHTILRILYRTEEESDFCMESVENLPPPQKKLYYNICKLAYEMTLSSKQVMKQVEVQSFFKQGEKDSFGLVTIDKMAMRCGFQKMYTFHHLTFQEFLGASFIAKQDEKEQSELIEKYGGEKQMQQLWKFYCGLTEFDKECGKFKALISNTDHGSLFKIQCSFESQQSHVCDTAVENNTLSLSKAFLSPTNFSEIAYVISNTQQNPVERLAFERCSFDQEGVDVLVKKSGDKLRMLTTLGYYYCNIERLRMANHVLHSLPSLEFLDISNTDIGIAEIEAIAENLNHPSLKILKVGSRGNALYSSAELQLKLAETFQSKCKNFVNICFTGISGVKASGPLPDSFHCNYPDLNMTGRKLRLSEVKALSSEFILNPFYTRVTLIDCGIDDKAAICLSAGLNYCVDLESLELNFNSIGNDGALKICQSIKPCSKLRILDLSFNKISDSGAIEIARTIESMESLRVLLTLNNISSCNCIQGNIDFHTLRLSCRDLGDSCVAELISLVHSYGDCENIHQIYLHGNRIFIDGLWPLTLLKCSNLLELNLSSNNLGKVGAMVLAEAVKYYPMLQKLDVSSNHLESTGAKVIATALKVCTDMRHLKLNCNDIGSNGAKALAETLKCCVALQELEIHSNMIGRDGAKALAEALKDLANIIAINITSNRILNEGAIALADALKKHKNLQRLYLRDNMIQNDGIEHLADVLRNCREMSSLDVSCNGIDSSGVEVLANSLPNSLREFDISDNNLGSDGVGFLADALSNCRSIQKINIRNTKSSAINLATMLKNSAHSLSTLDISNNNVLSDDCKSIADSLKRCINLHELNVSSNPIGSAGIKTIADSLKHLTNLRVLSVGSSNIAIQNEGAQDLAQALLHCTGIQVLSICSNNIGSPGAKAIADTLSEHCTKLSVLDISNNCIGSDGINALSSILVHCTSLQELIISNSGIEDDIHEFAQSLKHCTNLHKLDISDNSILDSGLETLSDDLIYCANLTELHMRKTLYDGGNSRVRVEALAKILKYCTTISVLDISINFIGDDGAMVVADALLYRNVGLTKLLVKGNIIGPSGAQELAKVLQHCSDLHTLDISYNSIQDSGAKALAQALQRNSQFNTLCVSYNEIGPSGTEVLVNSCTNLRNLDIGYNFMGDVGAKALAKALQCNTRLVELYVGCNKIGPSGTEALVNALQYLANLRILDISHNSVQDAGAKALATAFEYNYTRLGVLYMNYNQIGPIGAATLTKALQMKLHQLHTIDISGNQISMEQTELLKSTLF